jgi:fibronectin-binding autotransporter adhesin
LQTGGTNVLGAATNVIVSSGATLDVNGQALYGNGSVPPVTISGAGVGGNGAIVNNSTSDLTKTLHVLTLAADATVGGSANWDIRNSTGSGAPADGQLNGAFNLTKVGTNTFSMRGVSIDPSLGNINVQSGSLTITATASAPVATLGNASATITVCSNAQFTLDTIGNVPDKLYVLTNSGSLKSADTNTLGAGSTIFLTGAANNGITVNSGAQFTINSVISGPGGFTKNGGNVLFLTTANTYSGSTVVSSGTLALYGGGDGSIASSTNININPGATLDVSGRTDGTFTLMSGQTLNGGIGGGPGLINGILIANAGSVIAPGGLGSTNLGSISISSNVTLQGSTSLKLNPANGTNSWIGAYGITYGGSLTVTNLSTAFTNGQTFQLFVAANGVYNAATFSSVTLPTVPGVTWTTNLAVNGTITATVVPVIPPTPTITHIGLVGADLHLNGTNGALGGTFYVVASTNLTVPLTNWPAISTNTFTGSGTFNVTVTNAVDPNVPQTFYSIKQTY